jgi:excisionase family DNA binding protein
LVLTAEEAAAMLRIPLPYFYRRVERGQIPGIISIGRTLRVNRETFLAWLAGHRTDMS